MKYIKKWTNFESLTVTIGSISGILLFDKLRKFIKKENSNRKLTNIVMDMLQMMKEEQNKGLDIDFLISDFPDYYRLYQKSQDSYVKVYKNENKVIWYFMNKSFNIDIIDFYRKVIIKYIENQINHGDYLKHLNKN